jgi:hypothetical protein
MHIRVALKPAIVLLREAEVVEDDVDFREVEKTATIRAKLGALRWIPGKILEGLTWPFASPHSFQQHSASAR